STGSGSPRTCSRRCATSPWEEVRGLPSLLPGDDLGVVAPSEHSEGATTPRSSRNRRERKPGGARASGSGGVRGARVFAALPRLVRPAVQLPGGRVLLGHPAQRGERPVHQGAAD